jgi:hypothetical protein
MEDFCRRVGEDPTVFKRNIRVQAEPDPVKSSQTRGTEKHQKDTRSDMQSCRFSMLYALKYLPFAVVLYAFQPALMYGIFNHTSRVCPRTSPLPALS